MSPESPDEETLSVALPDDAPTGLVLFLCSADLDLVLPLPASGRVILGRSAGSTLRIDHPTISRRHAILDIGPPVRVEDVGSANGIRVLNRHLTKGESAEIAVGEMFQLGSVAAVILPRAGYPSIRPTPSRPASSEATSLELDRAIDDFRPPRLSGGEPVIAHPAMRRIYQFLERVSAGEISVLLLGETGVGKELLAEALHVYSPRASQAFLRLNCSALSSTLLESELFGHERGAFTGATHTKPGLLESANGGTVFLDEIGELPLAVQVRLLRVIEARQVTRVGALRPIDIDVRFVTATHRDLKTEIERGTFRQDLFFRLNGITMHIPPLRERTDEVVPIANAMLIREATRAGRAVSVLSREAIEALLAYRWPGNVRELRNVVERAALLAAGGEIAREHLPPELLEARAAVSDDRPSVTREGPKASISLGNAKEQLERERIVAALRECDGNQTRAAEMLGIPRRTLVRRIAEYDIPRGRKSP